MFSGDLQFYLSRLLYRRRGQKKKKKHFHRSTIEQKEKYETFLIATSNVTALPLIPLVEDEFLPISEQKRQSYWDTGAKLARRGFQSCFLHSARSKICPERQSVG